jgi:MFS-type transporter involved in bile tolerance (Atg22 family)
LHSPLAGLLTFFSAIGGTFGSRIVGYLFREIGGNKAFYFSLVPLILLIFLLYLLDKKIRKSKAQKIV